MEPHQVRLRTYLLQESSAEMQLLASLLLVVWASALASAVAATGKLVT